jgi:hypothetical protein
MGLLWSKLILTVAVLTLQKPQYRNDHSKIELVANSVKGNAQPKLRALFGGVRRYPPDGYFTSYGDQRFACSCEPSCADKCAGDCGCSACEQSFADSLEE